MDTIVVLPQSYTVIYTSSISSNCSSRLDLAEDCNDGVCDNKLNLSSAESSHCLLNATDIDVAVFATNHLGNGAISDPITIGIIIKIAA